MLTRASRLFYQPVDGFFTRLEGGELALGKTLEVFVEHFGQTFRPYPRGTLHVRTIEDQRLFDASRNFLVDFRVGKVSHRKHGVGWRIRYSFLNFVHYIQHFLRRAIAEVDQHDLPALMLDKLDAFFHASRTL